MARAVWQISGGPASRAFADVLLRYGVGLIGPGDAGPWSSSRDDDEFDGGFVRRFASELGADDILLLRTGTAKIRAVGLVASEYVYLSQFDDVNGWDLQHARRVRWSALPTEYDFGAPVFGANPTRLGRVLAGGVTDYAFRFLESPPKHWQETALPSLPDEDPPLDDSPEELRGLLAEIRDLQPVFWDRDTFGDHPTEDELIAHFVIPLLRALAWRLERIAIKWHHIDVAPFKALPRTPENCHLVIEAKRLGAGVEGALQQARGYVEALGVPRDIIVTDGVRYRMYGCDRAFASVAYANLARLKRPALELFARLRRP